MATKKLTKMKAGFFKGQAQDKRERLAGDYKIKTNSGHEFSLDELRVFIKAGKILPSDLFDDEDLKGISIKNEDELTADHIPD